MVPAGTSWSPPHPGCSSLHRSVHHVEATSSGAVHHSEEDSGTENQQKRVRRRKRAHRFSENVQNRRSGGGSRRVEAVTLFQVLTMGRSAMQAVVDDWIQAYGSDRTSALLDLISFFIQCSGCKGVVAAEMCQSRDDGDVQSQMGEELDEEAGVQYKKFLAFPWILTVTWPLDTDGAEYPLARPGPAGRWFHSELSEFVSVLAAQCRRGVLFDGCLMSTLLSLLTQLSDSYVRAFRHTCTLAALKLLSSLVGVALSLAVGIENSQKLLAVQRAKTTRGRSPQQLEKIQKKIAELQEQRAEVETMMDVIFRGVFLKRYRDVLPEVRSICVEELSVWMQRGGSRFLNDAHLKYAGWMLHDKAADVRLRCVSGLQSLYADALLQPQLNLFTSRFKDRMVSMTLDKDSEVALQTMKLLLIISRTSEDVLSVDDYQNLLQLVYSSQRPLAAAAGELLFSRLLAAAPDVQEEVGEEQQTFWQLKALLRFHQESELHQHVVYLVDGLWDCAGALLKDWSMFTSLLLQEPSGFTPAEEELLVEILVASVRQASEGPVLAGRSGAKKVMNTREKKVQTDDCLKITDQLLLVLPQLLSKFSSRPDVVASLMKVPQFFSDSPDAAHVQALRGLMAPMAAVLELHADPAVLEAAARSYLSLCGGGAGWGDVATVARDAMVQRWVERLTELLRGDRFSADGAVATELLSTLQKLRAFLSCHDLRPWGLLHLLAPLLSEDGCSGGAPAELLQEVLQCSSFSLLWSLSSTLTCSEEAASQRVQLRLFCDSSHGRLSHPHPAVRNQAFLGVCDVLMAHSYRQQAWDPASVSPLLYTPSPRLQRALLTFVCAHVFVGADGHNPGSDVEKLEDLQRRRTLLAAYCKLVVQGVLEMSSAAEVFMFYVKYYNDYGDIIKETLCRTRQVDKVESARALVLCLQQLFLRLKQQQQEGGGRSSSGVQTFSCIRELARRFALTFGDLVKFRECVVMIHRTGIEFVFQARRSANPPPYLSYLSILSEFSCKLLRPDRRSVFLYLQTHVAAHVAELRDESWQPLVHYRASLLAEAEDAAPQEAGLPLRTAPGTPGSKFPGSAPVVR